MTISERGQFLSDLRMNILLVLELREFLHSQGQERHNVNRSGDRVRRREVLSGLLLAGMGMIPAHVGHALEAKKIPRIGYLGTNIGPDSLPPIAAFRQGLRQSGYVEGQNIIIEYRWARGPADPVAAAHAEELAGLNLDLAVAGNATYVPLLRQASSTIPIVFCSSLDPVAEGVVAGLARPGGNSTGLSIAPAAFWGKTLEILMEGVPGARRVAVLWDPTSPDHKLPMTAVDAAARRLAVELRPVPVRTADEFAIAFAAMTDAGAEAILVLTSSVSYANRARLSTLALEHHLPSMFGFREGPDSGGLLSYGPDLNAAFRRCALYVDKIIKGAKPAELPVEQTSTFILYPYCQPQDRKGTRSHDFPLAARPRRRGDRMSFPL
jgi:putative tryptophan/tyrosine transport system substrate-binding protein